MLRKQKNTEKAGTKAFGDQRNRLHLQIGRLRNREDLSADLHLVLLSYEDSLASATTLADLTPIRRELNIIEAKLVVGSDSADSA